MEIPFHKLYGQEPDYTTLWIFGCRCFPYIRDKTANKFHAKSYPCIFVGYSTEHRGYRCCHPPTRKIFISRHVIFDESVLPYKNPSFLDCYQKENEHITTYYDFLKWKLPDFVQETLPHVSCSAGSLFLPLDSAAPHGSRTSDVVSPQVSTQDVGPLHAPTHIEDPKARGAGSLDAQTHAVHIDPHTFDGGYASPNLQVMHTDESHDHAVPTNSIDGSHDQDHDGSSILLKDQHQSTTQDDELTNVWDHDGLPGTLSVDLPIEPTSTSSDM